MRPWLRCLFFKLHTVAGALIPPQASSLVVAIVPTKITSMILLYLWISLIIPPLIMIYTIGPCGRIQKNTCGLPLPLYTYSSPKIF